MERVIKMGDILEKTADYAALGAVGLGAGILIVKWKPITSWFKSIFSRFSQPRQVAKALEICYAKLEIRYTSESVTAARTSLDKFVEIMIKHRDGELSSSDTVKGLVALYKIIRLDQRDPKATLPLQASDIMRFANAVYLHNPTAWTPMVTSLEAIGWQVEEITETVETVGDGKGYI